MTIVQIPAADLKPGDLVRFDGTPDGDTVTTYELPVGEIRDLGGVLDVALLNGQGRVCVYWEPAEQVTVVR